MISPIYSVWLDPVFYIAAAVFALALFLLVFSIKKYLGIKNKSYFEEADDEAGKVQDELPLTACGPGGSEAAQVNEQSPPIQRGGHGFEAAPTQGLAAAETAPEPGPAPAVDASQSGAPSRAEEFVKGLYDRLTSLDGRVKNIEADLSKSKVNRDFTTKFLEDIVADFDALDKTKIKARIEYLLADLKK